MIKVLIPSFALNKNLTVAVLMTPNFVYMNSLDLKSRVNLQQSRKQIGSLESQGELKDVIYIHDFQAHYLKNVNIKYLCQLFVLPDQFMRLLKIDSHLLKITRDSITFSVHFLSEAL